jgi:hypothetical protein
MYCTQHFTLNRTLWSALGGNCCTRKCQRENFEPFRANAFPASDAQQPHMYVTNSEFKKCIQSQASTSVFLSHNIGYQVAPCGTPLKYV